MKRPEQQIHCAVVRHLQTRGSPGMVFLHPANGGARSAIEGAMFKKMGVRAGASDLLLFHRKEAFALELKADGGRLSESQRDFQEDFRNAGFLATHAEGLDEALRVLEIWGLLL